MSLIGAHYILAEDDKTPIACSAEEWAKWLETSEDRRVVARTNLGALGEVSTVFLGLNHNFGNYGKPILWETMCFEGPLDEGQWRDTSWSRAVARHRLVVRKLWQIAMRLFPNEEPAIRDAAAAAFAQLGGKLL